MKQFKAPIIALVVGLLLLGAYFGMDKMNLKPVGEKVQPSPTPAEKIIDFSDKKVVEFSIQNKNGKFSFLKKEDKWTVVEPTDLKIDTTQIETIAGNLQALQIKSVAEAEAKDLEVYGLTKPAIVKAKSEDGQTAELEVGNATPTKEGYYVKLKDSKKVCILASYEGDFFVADASKFKDKLVFPYKEDEIKGFAFERAGQQVFKAQKSTNWKTIEPIAFNLDETKFTPILQAFTTYAVQEYVESKATDFTKYGLDKPSYAFEIEGASGKVKLLLGAEKEKDVAFYAKRSDNDEVFTVPATSLDFLDKPLKEFYDSMFYYPNIKDVTRVEAQFDGTKVISEIKVDKEENKDKDVFMVNGVDIKKKDATNGDKLFREFYQALIGVKVGELEIGAQPSGTPAITIAFTLTTTPNNVKLELISKDDKNYYLMKDGKYSGILVKKADFEEPESLKATFKKLDEIIKK